MALVRMTAEEIGLTGDAATSASGSQQHPATQSPQPSDSAAQGPRLRVMSAEEVAALGAQTATAPSLTEQVKESRPTFFQRMVSRALALDIDDPLQYERMGTTTLGAIGGSMAGTRVPTAPGLAGAVINPVVGAAIGGAAGAVAGTVAPEATLEGMEALGLAPPGYREQAGLSNEELMRLAESELLLDLLTTGGAAGVRAAARGLARGAAGMTKEATALADEAARLGLDVAPFQAGNRGAGVVNVLGRFPLIGTRARELAGRQAEQFAKIKETLPGRVGQVLSQAELGPKIFNDARNLAISIDKQIGERYQDLYLRANQLGVRYQPKDTINTARTVMDKIDADLSRSVTGKALPASESAQRVKDFIEANLSPLGDVLPGGGAVRSKLTLGQMDELIVKLDELVEGSDDAVRKKVLALVAPLRAAIKSDVTNNALGDAAEQIGREMADLDAGTSRVLNFFLETPTAKKFESFRRGGLRGPQRMSDEATRRRLDEVARVVAKVDSPQAVEELRRLIEPDTERAIAARVLADVFDQSHRMTEAGETVFDWRKFEKLIGRGTTDSSRRDALQNLFSSVDLDAKTLDSLADVLRAIGSSPVPNASTFLARGATIGGAQSVIRAAIPVFLVGSAGAGVGGAGFGAISSLMFLAGARGLVSAIADPNNARSLRLVLDDEAKTVARRAAYLRLGRAALATVSNADLQAIGPVLIDEARDIFAAGSTAAGEALDDLREQSRTAREQRQ